MKIKKLTLAEISDLKNECAELRLANASLERQIREGQVRVGVRGPRLVFSYSRFAERTVPYTGDSYASSLQPSAAPQVAIPFRQRDPPDERPPTPYFPRVPPFASGR